MATTSIIVNSTNSGKVLQKTITNVNPNADNDKLATWGQMLTALTDNTYTKTDRVDKANCDTESGKQTATITLNKTTDTLANVKASAASGSGYSFLFNTTGDGLPYAYVDTESDPSAFAAIAPIVRINASNKALYLLSAPDQLSNAQNAFNVKICLPETDNYKAAEVTFTVTA